MLTNLPRSVAWLGLSAALLGCGSVAAVAGDASDDSDALPDLDGGPDIDAEAPLCPPGMAFIPGGTYEMAEVSGQVNVDAFCMDVTHVTSADYANCAMCSAAGTGDECNAGISLRDDDPANCVDFAQAEAYCQAFDKSLATEEQWEWAARGGDAGSLYPWGSQVPTDSDDPPLLCWFAGRNDVPFPGRPSATCPVGAHDQAAVHPFGLEDMSGNTWQWTASAGANVDTRVVRGGGWDNTDATRMTTGFRNDAIPETVQHPALGFRCVREPLE